MKSVRKSVYAAVTWWISPADWDQRHAPSGEIIICSCTSRQVPPRLSNMCWVCWRWDFRHWSWVTPWRRVWKLALAILPETETSSGESISRNHSANASVRTRDQQDAYRPAKRRPQYGPRDLLPSGPGHRLRFLAVSPSGTGQRCCSRLSTRQRHRTSLPFRERWDQDTMQKKLPELHRVISCLAP